MDINILFAGLADILCCQVCHGKIKFSESEMCGLGFKINMICSNCKLATTINSSGIVDPSSSAYEVNRSSGLAAKVIGCAELSALCDAMNLPKSETMLKNDFSELVKQELNETLLVNTGIVKKEVDQSESIK